MLFKIKCMYLKENKCTLLSAMNKLCSPVKDLKIEETMCQASKQEVHPCNMDDFITLSTNVNYSSL